MNTINIEAESLLDAAVQMKDMDFTGIDRVEVDYVRNKGTITPGTHVERTQRTDRA